MRRPPISTLFPDTTLFRALPGFHEGVPARVRQRRPLLVRRRRVRREVPPEADESLHPKAARPLLRTAGLDRKSTRLNSSHANISYDVFCLKKKNETRRCNK